MLWNGKTLRYNKFVVQSGGSGLGHLFTAVSNHVATSPSARGDMIHHSREQVSKSPPPDRTTNKASK